MKKLISVLLLSATLFTLCACKDKGDLGAQTKVNEANVVEYNTVSDFDYSDFKKENEAKAITEGFKNTKATKCKDKGAAKALAVKEVEGFTYNQVKISYDRTEGIWMISYTNTENNKTQNVCIDENGVTVLIVKGE